MRKNSNIKPVPLDDAHFGLSSFKDYMLGRITMQEMKEIEIAAYQEYLAIINEL